MLSAFFPTIYIHMHTCILYTVYLCHNRFFFPLQLKLKRDFSSFSCERHSEIPVCPFEICKRGGTVRRQSETFIYGLQQGKLAKSPEVKRMSQRDAVDGRVL